MKLVYALSILAIASSLAAEAPREKVAPPALSDLISYTELARLDAAYKDAYKAILDGVAVEENQKRHIDIAKQIRDENRKRIAVWEQVEKGANISDYPGLLEKLQIQFIQDPNRGGPIYRMYFLCHALKEEGEPVLWAHVKLDGTIATKVKTAWSH
jgi:hypothetical protein